MKRILIPIGFILVCILAAQILAPPEYAWMQNTISELGAQGLPNAWVMRLGFVGFGLLLAGVLLRILRTERPLDFSDVGVFIYGIAIAITGFYSAAPYLPGIEYSPLEAGIHGLFASFAGLFLTIAILSAVIREKDLRRKTVHIVFFLLVTGFSILFGLADSGEIAVGVGLLQRLLWLAGFGWLYWRY